MKIPVLDEAELRRDTTIIYKDGGIIAVLDCIDELYQCAQIMLHKLDEILLEEEKGEELK